jgi:hypothetical protein
MEIKPGDALVRRKLDRGWGLIYNHWGLCIDCDPIKIIERQEHVGVRIVSFKKFHHNHPYKVVPCDDEKRNEVVKRALKMLGDKTFSGLFDNCEHFVRYCQTGKRKSNQVRFTFLFFFILVTLAFTVLFLTI